MANQKRKKKVPQFQEFWGRESQFWRGGYHEAAVCSYYTSDLHRRH